MATVNITLTLNDAHVPAFRAFLAEQFQEADTNQNGNVSGPEAIAWIQLKCQQLLNTLAVERAMPWAEENAPQLLPQEYQDAITAKESAASALATERQKITRT